MKKITITLILVLSIGFGQGVTLDPTSIEFGPVTLNSTKYDTVQVTNDLGTAQTITFSGQSAPFSITPEAYSFAANESTNFILAFTPTSLGSFNQTLTTTGDVLATATLPLTGEGTNVNISVSPDILSFGNVALGQSLSKQLTVYNTGTGNMLISSITIGEIGRASCRASV